MRVCYGFGCDFKVCLAELCGDAHATTTVLLSGSDHCIAKVGLVRVS